MTIKNDGVIPVLWTRGARVRDHCAETAEIRKIAEVIALDPAQVMNACVAGALRFGGGTSAGICLLEDGPREQEQFRTLTVIGVLANSFPKRTARHISPCAICEKAGEVVMVSRPERVYPCLQAGPAIHEMLLAPLGGGGSASRGVVWIASHTPAPGFDGGDARFLQAIAALIVAGLEMAHAAALAREKADTHRLAFSELEHRVKNTLLTAATALGWEIERSSEPGEHSALEGARRRILAVAEMDRLTAIPDEVDIGTAIRGLCATVAGPDGRVKVAFADSQLRAPGPAVALVVMIVNELLTNAIKHASPHDDQVLTVSISLTSDGPGRAILAVTDNGGPFVTGATSTGSGLGLNLVRGLAKQLGGSLDIDTVAKRSVVTFPATSGHPRAVKGARSSGRPARDPESAQS